MMDLLNPVRWFKNRSFRNFLSLSFIQGSNMLVGILATPMIFGAVGEEQFGLITLALSIVMLLNVFVSYGYHMSGPRKVALDSKDSLKLSGLFSTILFSKGVLAFFCIGVIGLLIFYFGAFSNYSLILLFSLPLVLSEVVFPLWLLQGLERMKMLSIGNLIAKVIYVLLLYFFVQKIEDGYKVNFLLGVSALVVNIFLIILIRRKWKINLTLVKTKYVVQSIKENGYLFFSSLAGHISVNSGVIILSNIVTDSALGVYSLAQKVPFLIRMLPILVAQSMLPKASRLYRDDKNAFITSIANAYRLTLIISLLVSVVTLIFSNHIIHFLSAGTNTKAIEILNVMSFIPFLSALNIGNMLLVLSSDSKKLLFTSTWISTLVMLFLGVIGSCLFGVLGMSYALLLTELLTFLIQTFVNYRGMFQETSSFYRRCLKMSF